MVQVEALVALPVVRAGYTRSPHFLCNALKKDSNVLLMFIVIFGSTASRSHDFSGLKFEILVDIFHDKKYVFFQKLYTLIL